MLSSPSFADRLSRRMIEANSLLCVGLDPVLSRLPAHLPHTVAGVTQFCVEIVNATSASAAAYKPNLGFFVGLGRHGIDALHAVQAAIPAGIPVILDCKVGDVGETAKAYAHGWLAEFGFDALTVNPYLGEDSIAPFLQYEDKGAIILCKTSNPGSGDLQDLPQEDGDPLYLTVANRCRRWNEQYPASVGLVVGATYPRQLRAVRERVGDQVILLPGVGAQAGDLEAAIQAGLDSRGLGLLCSASRAIMYASSGEDYAEAARSAAISYRDQMNVIRDSVRA